MTTPIRTVKIQAWGNSQGVRLTRDMLRDIGIDHPKDCELDVEVVGNELRLSPALTPYERLFKDAHGVTGKTMAKANREFSWDDSHLDPTPRLLVTEPQKEAIYDYLDHLGHNKTLFMNLHQQRLANGGWTCDKMLCLNDVSIDDLGKALFVGMNPTKPEREAQTHES